MTQASCSIPDCEKRTRSARSEYCEMHYYRIRRTGSPTAARPWHRHTTCSVEGCDRPERHYQMCAMHGGRFQRHGSADLAAPRDQSGVDNPIWRGDEITYTSAHSRIVRTRGPAKRHQCVDCGLRAKDWSYRHTDPDQRNSEFGPYSPAPDHYDPRCGSCHKRFDLRMKAEPQAR